jgi:mRNA interferase HigB
MVVLGGPLLDQFALNHASARKSIATWRKGVEEATWNSRNDIIVSFPHAKIIRHNRARFEILHNKYRLVAEVSYKDRLVEVRFIGTHTEYDKIDASTI